MADGTGAAAAPGMDAALATYENAEAAYEAAMMSGDAERQIQTRVALREAAASLAHARSAWLVEQEASATPSFEDLLRDPWSQLDTEGVVLASIRQYKVTAGATATTAARQPLSQSVAAAATSAIYSELTADPSFVAAGVARWQQEAPTPGRTLQHTP